MPDARIRPMGSEMMTERYTLKSNANVMSESHCPTSNSFFSLERTETRKIIIGRSGAQWQPNSAKPQSVIQLYLCRTRISAHSYRVCIEQLAFEKLFLHR